MDCFFKVLLGFLEQIVVNGKLLIRSLSASSSCLGCLFCFPGTLREAGRARHLRPTLPQLSYKCPGGVVQRGGCKVPEHKARVADAWRRQRRAELPIAYEPLGTYFLFHLYFFHFI